MAELTASLVESRNFKPAACAPITFVTAANSREILQKNLLASPCLQSEHAHQILVQEGFASAAKAYNAAIEKSDNDLLVFLHQDVILPNGWLDDLRSAIAQLDSFDPNWGVLGCAGQTHDNQLQGYIYSQGLGIIGEPFQRPAPVQTLDEIVLIFRKSSGLRFDDTLPGFHMYGTDICMAAAARGMRNYAISAFCVHNTVFNLVLPKEFYDCYKYVRRTRQRFLPIQTTCVRITRFGLPMYIRRLREFCLVNVCNKRVAIQRESEPQKLLKALRWG